MSGSDKGLEAHKTGRYTESDWGTGWPGKDDPC